LSNTFTLVRDNRGEGEEVREGYIPPRLEIHKNAEYKFNNTETYTAAKRTFESPKARRNIVFFLKYLRHQTTHRALHAKLVLVFSDVKSRGRRWENAHPVEIHPFSGATTRGDI
jgi:hypothetical protein